MGRFFSVRFSIAGISIKLALKVPGVGYESLLIAVLEISLEELVLGLTILVFVIPAAFESSKPFV